MYEVLKEKAMIKIEDKWISTKAVLTNCKGGKQIDFVKEDGTVIKTEPYSRNNSQITYEVLEENVMVKIEDKWMDTKAILTTCKGGRHVDYVNEDGNVLKTEPYSRSRYAKEDKKKKK